MLHSTNTAVTNTILHSICLRIVRHSMSPAQVATLILNFRPSFGSMEVASTPAQLLTRNTISPASCATLKIQTPIITASNCGFVEAYMWRKEGIAFINLISRELLA